MNNRAVNIGTIHSFFEDELAELYPRSEAMALSRRVIHHVTGMTTASILSGRDTVIPLTQWDKISKICYELKEGKPLQYITGKATFYGLSFTVNPAVLIPRPETEELVDLILKENRGTGLRILDIGTGSGCIAIALARNAPGSDISAIDISTEALVVASKNAEKNSCDISFYDGDILDPAFNLSSTFDIIVSNPPYVRILEKRQMSYNVTGYEPGKALYVPDDDPLVYYRHIMNFGQRHLSAGGIIYLEINEAFGREILGLTEKYGYTECRLIKDLNNRDRIITGRYYG